MSRSTAAATHVLVPPDPHARQDPLFCGVAITPFIAPAGLWGSLGCFIHTTGKQGDGIPNGGYPAGVYLLTNQHVIQGADPRNPHNPPPHDTRIIQPNHEGVFPPAADTIGNYVDGYSDAANDCAIASLNGSRGRINAVPWGDGSKSVLLIGVRQAAVGDVVYKFGASTLGTRGVVTDIDYNDPPHITGAIRIRAHPDQYGTWVNGGDSGSIVIRQDADGYVAVALNVRGDYTEPAHDGVGYRVGFAFDLQRQMNNFCGPGGQVKLEL